MIGKRDIGSFPQAAERAREGYFGKAELVAMALARRAGGDIYEIIDHVGIGRAPRWLAFKAQAYEALRVVAEVEFLISSQCLP